jgi:hypothetical protein
MSTSRGEVSILGDALFWDADGLPASPWTARIPFLAWLVENLQPRSVVELGTGRGDSFRPLCLAVGRFAAGGKVLGVDDRSGGSPVVTGMVPSDGVRLQEFCETRCPDTASVISVGVDEASKTQEVESIDLLHVTSEALDTSADLTKWLPKIRPGGVILLSGSIGDEPSDTPANLWSRAFEGLPSASLDLLGPIGLAQVPAQGRAAIIEFLSSKQPQLGGLFHALGERDQFRHLLNGRPTTPKGITNYIDRLLEDHLREVQRSQAIHKLEAEMAEERLAASADRTAQQAQKINELERENNLLLAKLARYASVHARQLDDSQAEFTRQMGQLQRVCEVDTGNLRGHVDYLQAELTAIRATSSWRITRPLRAVRRALLRVKSVGVSR